MPNVLTADLLKRMNVPVAEFNRSFEAMMRAGMDRLMALQRPSGGWGWFDNDGEDPFMTACAVHGLSECDRLGYPVDKVALKRGRERLRAMAKEEKDPNRLAYAAYVLGDEFDRLLASPERLSSYAQALLVLALRKAGRAEAMEVAKALEASVRKDHWETPGWYYKWDNVSIETTAYAIQALAAIRPGHALIAPAVEWLLAQRQGPRWRSTKDTAVAIATLLQVTSLGTLTDAVAVEAKPEEALLKKIAVVLNGGERREILIDLNNPLKSAFEAHFPRVNAGPNLVAFESMDERSDFKFELAVTQRVFEARFGSEARGLDVNVGYDRPLDGLRVGDEVTATVTVSASQPVDYVMVQSPIPSGGEVIRGSGTGEFARFEDRYEKALFFLRSVGAEPVRLQYKMRCAYAGRFTVLPASAGLMYNEGLYGTGGPSTALIRP